MQIAPHISTLESKRKSFTLRMPKDPIFWRLQKLKKDASEGVMNADLRLLTLQVQPVPERTLLSKFCKYAFKPPPPQVDPLIATILHAISELFRDREHGMLVSNSNFRVMSSTDAPPIWPIRSPCSQFLRTKMYTFAQDGEEFPATVHVSIQPYCDPLCSENVHVRIREAWIPIKQWLLTLANPKLLEERAGIKAMNQWWPRNGQFFNLMGLPAELRYMILEQAVAPEVYPLSQSITDLRAYKEASATDLEQSLLVLGIGYSRHLIRRGSALSSLMNYTEVFEDLPGVPPPCLDVLLTNKKVHEEALQAVWNTSRKCFLAPVFFDLAVKSGVGPALKYNILGRIRLNFTNKSWFEFFGVIVDNSTIQVNSTSSMGHRLSGLSRTTDLELHFRDPEDGYLGDPWPTVEKTTCQSVMVDWIMTFAYPFIRHISTVKIIGYVKRPQKDRWEYILSSEVAGRPHGFDHATALATILNTPPRYLPPPCICRRDCACKEASRWVYWWMSGFRDGSNFDFEN
ncbi:hypothetical protein P154DRAFT_465878, partial [Amniculicola lignicola CBS 123094]